MMTKGVSSPLSEATVIGKTGGSSQVAKWNQERHPKKLYCVRYGKNWKPESL